MKSPQVITLVLVLQLVLVVAHIYKENLYIQASYQQQRLERMQQELHARYQTLQQQLLQLQNHTVIAKHAREKLHLQPVPLSAVRRLHAQQPA